MNEVYFACKNCFRDKNLIEWIEKDGRIDDCSWCGSTSVKGLPLSSLGEKFREIISIYEEGTGFNGDSIGYLIQEDWEVFSDLITEPCNNQLNDFTVAILRAGIDPKNDVDLPDFNASFYRRRSWIEEDWGNSVEKLFDRPLHSHQKVKTTESSRSGEWQLPPKTDVLKYVFEELAEKHSSGKIYYRARIHKNRNRVERFLPGELGAPDPKHATAGRGNYKGQPVLYLASDDKTAISEVRPWKDSAVAVGCAHLLKDINVINLTNYGIPKSPFFEQDLYWKIWISALFYRLAEELSRPVMPHEEETFYKPTQHLCERIKKSEYDGVIYPSGLGPGNNIILFDTKIVKVKSISYVRIDDINFLTDTLGEKEVIYEETPYDHFIRQQEK